MADRIRFYTDEHIPKAVIRGLRQRGVDVLTVSDANLLGASDKEHLQRAQAETRVLVTQDEDYLRLHAGAVDHAGIAYAPQGSSVGDIVRGLMLIYSLLDPHDMKDHIEFL